MSKCYSFFIRNGKVFLFIGNFWVQMYEKVDFYIEDVGFDNVVKL